MTESPADLLAVTGDLRSRARLRRRGHWLPLTLFGLLGLTAAPLYPSGQAAGSGSVSGPRVYLSWVGGEFTGHPAVIGLLWLLGIPVVCTATAGYYRWRAVRVGLGSRIWPFAVVALLLDATLLLLAVLRQRGVLPVPFVSRGLLSYVVIAAAAGVLAWLERVVTLAVVAAVLLALTVVVNLYDTENLLFRLGVPVGTWTNDLPNPLLPALYLLLAGAISRARAEQP